MFVQESKNQWIIFGGPWFLALIFGIMAPLGPITITAFLLLIIGSVLIILAKISEKKRTKIWVEFGYKRMTPQEKRKYILGYILLITSLCVLAFQLVA